MELLLRKLHSTREGHRRVIANQLTAIEEANCDSSDFETILNALTRRQLQLTDVDQHILEQTEPDAIADEMVATEEHALRLAMQISHLRTKRATIHAGREAAMPLLPLACESDYTPNIPSSAPSFPAVSVQSSTQFHKLPKLSLPTFVGDILQWQTVWDSFESTVHLNPTLSDIQEFNYLKVQLEDDAARTKEGFALTNANYALAVDLLRERFGQPHKITHAYMQALLNIPAPQNNLHSLRSYYDKLEAYIRGLESMGQDSYGILLVPVIIGKLPPEIRKSLAREHGDDNWQIRELRRAICKEINIIEACQPTAYTDTFQSTSTATFFTGSQRSWDKPCKNSTQGPVTTERNAKVCAYCRETHASNDCNNVSDYNSRINIVKRNKLCFNCLGNHLLSNCRSQFRCRNCQRKHHTSICDTNLIDTYQASAATTTHANTVNSDNTNILQASAVQSRSNVLLKTAIAPVCSAMYSSDANILFDEGAQRSFITEDLANKLHVKRNGTDTVNISVFGDSNNQIQHLDKTTIHLVTENGDRIGMQALIVPKIAVPLQNRTRNTVGNISYLKGLKMAHPLCEDETFEISLLIGADYYWDVVQDKIIRGDGPTAVQSKIGFLLSGPVAGTPKPLSTDFICNVLASHAPIVGDLEQFWKLESLCIDSNETDKDDTHYLEDYQRTSISFANGKYNAKLPWKEDHPPLPTNFDITRRRTESTIRRLSQDPSILKTYGDIIADQEQRGFIERVEEKCEPAHKVHYIPHHAVKKDSSTTPIPIVYECSCHQSHSQPSLISEPPLLNDLTSILVRFRLHKFAICTDIEKAFLHIGLDEKDRDVTRFLWLSDPGNPNSPLITYRFKAILFGATCSPFILNATLLKHITNNNSYVGDIIKRDLYVDNVISSFQHEHDVLTYFGEARDMMAGGGFNLRSWTSNSSDLRSLAISKNVFDSDETTKVLGMKWDVETEQLSFPEWTHASKLGVTKRYILQQTSRIYDPLGILSPVTIRAKILIQELWKQKFEWDVALPADIHEQWENLSKDLDTVTKVQFARHYFSVTPEIDEKTTLHIFVDASIQSYGAVAYLSNDRNQSTLVMAKSRVAPLKSLTLPRLELMAALIGVRLAKHLQKTIACQEVVFRSDSQIVLHWLSSSKPLTRFVHNRVTEIRELSKKYTWRYCPTDDNPADLLTRGLSAVQYRNSNAWTAGPTWIMNRSQWPIWHPDYAVLSTSTEDTEDHDTGLTTQSPGVQTRMGIDIIMDVTKFSKYRRLLRVTAYVRRFVINCRTTRVTREAGPITDTELQVAEKMWLHNCQTTVYENEILSLKSKSNRLPLVKQLRLFLDTDENIRCGGRIHNAPVADSTKFPYLLPAKNPLTALIVRNVHENQLHSGVSATITHIRQTYWIPTIRQCVKKLLRKCVICRKVSGRPYPAPDPAPLPKTRVQEAPPFTVTGVDFTGALYVKGKSGCESKAYICLFTCASTRAVHLEVMTDMTEESFLQAFRQFASRKSLPQIMISDNASTFMAASNYIKRLLESQSLNDALCKYGTQWQFIPKRAPWYGGWWERLVGITKTSLKKILGLSYVTLETLQTVVTEIEAVMNDRPLTHVSSSPDEPEPLTPSCLLYGRRITSVPYPAELSDAFNNPRLGDSSDVKQRATTQSNSVSQFWRRWKSEYLTGLREYHRTSGNNSQAVRVGDVVQIHDDSPRLRWKLGIIDELLTGNDGLVRAVKLRTANGLLTSRPITKLYPLEVY